MKYGGNNNVVYSTDHGSMCPGCRMPVAKCDCSKKQAAPVGDGIVRISRQSKGRRGKGVTIITGLMLNKGELKQLARELKAVCGCGGTVKDGLIEIQGDSRDRLMEILKEKGFKVKLAGG